MNIVINAFSARLGGGQTYLKNLLAHLPAHDDSLRILVYAPPSLTLPEDPRIVRGVTSWPTQNPLLRSLWERFGLPRVLARERADVLFCPGGLVSTRAPAGCRTVTMFRNMTPFDERAHRAIPFGLQRMRNWLLKPLMLRSMARADLTIFISDFARKVIEGYIRIPSATTIPHGIGSAFRTGASRLPRPERLPAGKCVLYVSKFDSYKHQTEVVAAFGALPAALQQAYTLVLAGETDHRCAQEVEQLRAGLKEPARVCVLGAVPYADLPAFYHHADATLFASSCENCPNILLEAMASGRPVLSSNVMPMPEFGGTGIEYFSPFDPADIARAMANVLGNPARAESVATAALTESRRFDWERTAMSTWTAMADLVGRRAHA